MTTETKPLRLVRELDKDGPRIMITEEAAKVLGLDVGNFPVVTPISPPDLERLAEKIEAAMTNNRQGNVYDGGIDRGLEQAARMVRDFAKGE